ncbi:MAG: FAD-binding protein [Candidatus Heimdallarchaeota archaeon]
MTAKLVGGYPEYMRESIENVERTRDRRLKESFKMMSLDQRSEVLNAYHPDFKAEGKRAIQFGPNTGDRVPNEFADKIEAHPIIFPGDIDLSVIDYDVDLLIIGGGGAGTVAALFAYHEGIPADEILMVTKLRHGDANSMMAQGGIQAADRPEDDPYMHYLDIVGGGHFTNDPSLARILATEAPLIIDWHEKLGVMYDKNPDGSYVELPGGGTSRRRMHSAKDYTGMEIMRVIRDEMRNKEIPCIEFTSAVGLILDEAGNSAGAILYNMETQQYYVCRAKATVLATGGSGRLHYQGFATTNHYGATGDGLIMAYHAGAKFVDMDSIQYHPTGAAYPEQIVGLLITEKVRGMGAQPLNKHGEMFVYPLEPRDVEAAALIRECYANNNGITTPTGFQGVWLDSPMIELIHGEGTIRKNLEAMYRMLNRFDIDMTVDPILVFPTLHYQNGGVWIDESAQTQIKGLFAGGEQEGGVHGKNRLMGNSLLDYNVFGRRAGISAAQHVKKASVGKLTLAHLDRYEKWLSDAGVQTERRAPMLLPEYRGKEALSRALDIL